MTDCASSIPQVHDFTFENDPLFDTKGLTCNGLISEKCMEKVFLYKDILNIYAALVKPNDFTCTASDDRYPLFMRTPWVRIDPSILHDKVRLSGLSDTFGVLSRELTGYTKHQFKSDFRKIKYRLKENFRSGNVPLVVLRLFARCLAQIRKEDERRILSEILVEASSLKFLKSQAVKLPLRPTEAISASMVYLVGYLAADGYIGKNGEIGFSDGNPDVSKLDYSRKHLENISSLTSQLFRIKLPSLSKMDGNMYRLSFRNKAIARFLNFFFSHPLGMKYKDLAEPQILSLLNGTLKTSRRNIFWRGYVDGDGNISKNSVRVSAKNPIFLMPFYELLRDQGFYPSIHKRETQNVLTIHFFDAMRYAELVGVSHPLKQIKLIKSLMKGPNKWMCYGIKSMSLTSNGFFDLRAIGLGENQLKIVGAGSFLKSLRQKGGWSQGTLAGKMKVSASAISFWEHDSKAAPLRVIREIVKNAGLDFHAVLKQLDVRWRYGNSSIVKLPLRPSNELNTLVRYLSPIHSTRVHAKKVYIVHGFGDEKLNEKEFQRILNTFHRIFCLPIRSDPQHRHYVHNRTLRSFLLGYYDFRLPWNRIEDKQADDLLKKWSEELKTG